MRGSPPKSTHPPLSSRIIPAHAGLTERQRRRCRPHRDHPRACGAHECQARPCTVLRGSSPRMRGSLMMYLLTPVGTGIIPAHAGLTRRYSTTSRRARDHPRACGAHRREHRVIYRHLGSSPRMRGSLDCLRVRVALLGIIPAHAGLTYTARRPTDGIMGSSPRMRGSH